MYKYEYMYTYTYSHTTNTHTPTLQLAVETCPSTGWRRLIGSPKLQIIFHKRATKYMSLLRKMTCKDKASYESSPPCSVCVCTCVYMYVYINTHTHM